MWNRFRFSEDPAARLLCNIPYQDSRLPGDYVSSLLETYLLVHKTAGNDAAITVEFVSAKEDGRADTMRISLVDLRERAAAAKADLDVIAAFDASRHGRPPVPEL